MNKQTIPKICVGLSNASKNKLGQVLHPKWLWLEVTDRCNSRCEYCNVWQKTPTSNPLTPKEIGAALTDPLFKNVGYIINSGGEPTVRGDFLEVLLCEHVALPKATLQISTNGLLPERIIEVAEKLQNQHVPFEVGVSLDGIGEGHDKIRGVQGCFAKVEHLISVLKGMDVSVSAGATLSSKNLQENIKACEYSKKNGVNFMYHWFNTSAFYDNVTQEGAYFMMHSELTKLSKAIQNTMPEGLYRDLWLKQLRGNSAKFKCFALNTFAALKCNGDIVPCLSYWNQSIGNVREQTPTKIWNSLAANIERNQIKNCAGCLNSWGCSWSLQTIQYPLYINKLKRSLHK